MTQGAEVPADNGEQYHGDAVSLRTGTTISGMDYLEKVISFEALYESMLKCKKGVLWKESTASFYLNGVERVLKLEQQLRDGTYKARPPRQFKVMHPKEREIISIAFCDRVFQRSLNDNVIYPQLSKSFIYDNMACQKGKGTDKARDRLECFMQKSYRKNGRNAYVLQCDIKGYYPNMRHEVAKAVFQSKLDPRIFAMASEVLDGQYAGEVGFNPGSQMVQICGISVLDKLDHYIKEQLRIKYYIRYMDDLILIHNDQEYLQRCRDIIRGELNSMGMDYNEKKTRIYPITRGIKFLGFIFRLSETGKVYRQIDPKNVKAERKKLARMAALVKKGELTREKVDACYGSWRAHASKGNSYHLLKRMDKFYKELWRSKT